MDINPNIIAAAKKAVNEGQVADTLLMIPGYDQMFVSISGHKDIQSMDFFEIDGARYAVGPKRK